MFPENVLYSSVKRPCPTASFIFFTMEEPFPFFAFTLFSTPSVIFCLSFLSISCALSDNVYASLAPPNFHFFQRRLKPLRVVQRLHSGNARHLLAA